MSIYQGNNKLLGGITNIEENKIKEIIDNERPITTTIDSSSTDTQIPSAKSVYKLSKNARVINIPTWKRNVTITFTNTSGASALLLLQYGEYIPIVTAGGTAKIDPRTKVTTTPGNNLTWATDETNKLKITINNNASNITGSIIINNDPGAIVEFGTNNAPQAIIVPNPNYVADVPKTNITWSDETYFKSNDVVSTGNYYQVKNGICYVNIDMFCITPKNGGYTLPITLPRPSLDYVHVNIASLPSGIYEHSSVIMAIFNSGNSIIVYGGKANDRYLGSFSYPVAES